MVAKEGRAKLVRDRRSVFNLLNKTNCNLTHCSLCSTEEDKAKKADAEAAKAEDQTREAAPVDDPTA
jgi:hypothetical protein